MTTSFPTELEAQMQPTYKDIMDEISRQHTNPTNESHRSACSSALLAMANGLLNFDFWHRLLSSMPAYFMSERRKLYANADKVIKSEIGKKVFEEKKIEIPKSIVITANERVKAMMDTAVQNQDSIAVGCMVGTVFPITSACALASLKTRWAKEVHCKQPGDYNKLIPMM